MANKWMRKLGVGMSVIMTASQLSGMSVMAAAEEDDFEDVVEETYDADIDGVEEEDVSEPEIEEEDIDNVEVSVDELVPPTDIRWEEPGVLRWHIESDQPMIYHAEIFRDGEKVGSYGFGDLSWEYDKNEGVCLLHVGNYFEGSGKYTAKVYVTADDSYEAERVYASEIPEIDWTMPAQRVKTPENVHWEYRDSGRFAVAVCDAVEHPYRYWFKLYIDGESNGASGPTENEHDCSYEIGDTTEHSYTFSVWVESDDLANYANSLPSVRSEELSLGGNIINTQKDIVELGSDVNASNIDERVQQVKELDNSTLKTSLQTSNDALEAMGKIEGEYKDARGIEILPATSGVDKISADKIEMTGAALNVSEGTVQLNVKDPKENGSDLINTDIYTNIVAFDMDVDSSEGIDFSKELEVPVTISMPIPSGMNTSVMVILHYRADGTEELITPRIENGKAIFAITHFSLFAFAEKKNTELRQGEDGNYYYYEDGKLSHKTGFVNWEGSKFYVTDGMVDTTKNGIEGDWKDLDRDGVPAWYYLAEGQVVDYTGLAVYDGEWFYVENGKLDITKLGYVDYDGSKFYVAAGQIVRKQSGLTLDPVTGDWYYLAEGQVADTVTDLVEYDGYWFYIINGRLAEEYTGTVIYDGAEFNVVNGMVR